MFGTELNLHNLQQTSNLQHRQHHSPQVKAKYLYEQLSNLRSAKCSSRYIFKYSGNVPFLAHFIIHYQPKYWKGPHWKIKKANLILPNVHISTQGKWIVPSTEFQSVTWAKWLFQKKLKCYFKNRIFVRRQMVKERSDGVICAKLSGL